MPRIPFHIASYDVTRRIGRAIRAVAVMAWSVSVLQACNGNETTAPVAPIGAKGADANTLSAVVATTIATPIRLVVTGTDGRALRGASVVWTAADGGAVATTESVTDASGVASTRWTLGPLVGAQTLTAVVQGLAPVVFTANATADRAASIQFTSNASKLTVIGDSLRFAPSIVDRFGNSVSVAPTYSVESAADIATVTGNVLVARGRGVATVKVAVDTAVARIAVTIDPATPRISTVSVDTIVPGSVFSVEGQDFAWLTDAVDVTVAGVKATVLRATPSRIDAILPTGVVPCQAAALQIVKLTIAGRSSQKSMPLRVANRVSLARGESANMLDAEQVRCTELLAPNGAAHAKYVVAVINTSLSAGSTSGFEMRGSGAGALAGQNAVSRAPSMNSNAASGSISGSMSGSLINSSVLAGARAVSAGAVGAMPQESMQEHNAEAHHSTFLESQRSLSNRVGSPSPTWTALQTMRATRGVAAARAASNVGDTIIVKALYSSCSTGRDIKARVVYAGTKSVVLEDLAAPRVGQLDAQYRQLGDEFDKVMYPMLQSKMGDPLAMDAQMGGDGRVTMLFTRYVNDSLPGIAGYVTACNFYSKGTFAGSNEDEVFYARVAVNGEAPADWRRTMRSTVMHEAKHLAAFAERFARNTPLEEAWLEESTARIAEELYSRSFTNGGSWKGNTGFSTTVRCEVYQCDERPLMMWKHFSVLQQYMRGVDTLTPIGAATSGDFTYYASGWSLVRWAVDQYAGDESQWLKQLVRGSAATGLANLSQLTGRPAVEMLADWALANAVDDLAGFTPARKQLSFPSWNTAEVNGGLAGTYPTSFLASPLKARAMSFGSFALPVAKLRAFSSSYFSFDGDQLGSQLLELRGENGAAAPSGNLRVAVVRVE